MKTIERKEVIKLIRKIFRRELEQQTVGTDTIDKIEDLIKRIEEMGK